MLVVPELRVLQKLAELTDDLSDAIEEIVQRIETEPHSVR